MKHQEPYFANIIDYIDTCYAALSSRFTMVRLEENDAGLVNAVAYVDRRIVCPTEYHSIVLRCFYWHRVGLRLVPRTVRQDTDALGIFTCTLCTSMTLLIAAVGRKHEGSAVRGRFVCFVIELVVLLVSCLLLLLVGATLA